MMTRDELMKILKDYSEQKTDTIFCLVGNSESYSTAIDGSTKIMVDMIGNHAATDYAMGDILLNAADLYRSIP